MAPQMGVCLHPCGLLICALMAMGGIPAESQLSWLSGRHLILSNSGNVGYQLGAVEL
jgi:hypothetical protein